MKHLALTIIAYGLVSCISCAGTLAVAFYAFNHVLPTSVSESSFLSWVRVLFYVAIASIFGISYIKAVVEDWRKAKKAETDAYEGRRDLREGGRRFAAFMEDRYSWLLEMPEAEQKQRALLWFEQITTSWEEENTTFHNLMKSDDWKDVVTDLGPTATDMLELWRKRRVLYQYAIAFSTKATRAVELLKIEQQIQHTKVEAAKNRAAAERVFGSSVSIHEEVSDVPS